MFWYDFVSILLEHCVPTLYFMENKYESLFTFILFTPCLFSYLFECFSLIHLHIYSDFLTVLVTLVSLAPVKLVGLFVYLPLTSIVFTFQ